MLQQLLWKPQSNQGPKNEKLATWWIIPLLSYLSIIISLSFIPFTQLPEDRHNSADPEEFIGFKAKYYLRELTNIGPRVVGSKANEINTVNFLLKVIDAIAAESKGLYHIETDTQVVSGKYSAYGRINVYNAVQNVIVKLTPIGSNHSNAVLVNSHFDSVLTSPGAGDDGSGVAVMLGVLNSVMKSKKAVQHPLIFLFNGAEETGLEAAHGFITQHKWVKDIKIYISVDTLGTGGKDMLFQSGPENTWLLDYYEKAAKHPFASVMGEEIFRSGFLPSDSDPSIFRKYGSLPGLELLYIKNGYAYHTHMDKYSNIEDGSLQNAGDNVLALIKVLGNAEELDENYFAEPTGRGIYFDFLGLFFVNYSETAAIVLNSMISIFSLVIIAISIWMQTRPSGKTIKDVLKQFALTLLLQVGSIVIAVSAVLLIAFFIEIIHFSKSWYSQYWFVFGLYFCPILYILGFIPTTFLSSSFFSLFPLKTNLMLVLHSLCIILICFMIILTSVGIRSTFLVTYVVIFYLLAVLINLIPAFHRSDHLWIVPIIFCQSIPLAFNSYIAQIVYTVFIPITSRLRSEADVQIAFLAILSSILLFGFIIPIFSIFCHAKTILLAFLGIFIVSFILMFTPIGYPYTNVTPQRHIVHHMARTKHHVNGSITAKDSIFAANEYDHQTKATVKGIADKNDLEYFTWEKDNPDLIYFKSSQGLMRAPELHLPDPARLILLSKEQIPSLPGIYRLTFQITGGANTYRLSIIPRNMNTMVDWSFEVSDEDEPVKRAEEYNVKIQFGKELNPYTFWIIMDIAGSHSTMLSIGLHAQYLDEYNILSPDFNQFLNTFPRWTVITGIISSYDLYDF